jgi:hypothetical protein
MNTIIETIKESIGNHNYAIEAREGFFSEGVRFAYLGKEYVVEASHRGVCRLKVIGSDGYSIIEEIVKSFQELGQKISMYISWAEGQFRDEVDIVARSWMA